MPKIDPDTRSTSNASNKEPKTSPMTFISQFAEPYYPFRGGLMLALLAEKTGGQ
jgi:hypothetical protein